MQFFKVVGESEAECDDSECGIWRRGCDEAGCAGDEEVGDAVHFTIGIYDASVWVVAHAGGAHVVPAAAGEFGP